MIKYKTPAKKFLSKDDEKDLFDQYNKTKDAKLKNHIVELYGALCFHYAKKMSFQKYQYEDIVQEAFLGLSIAIDKFKTANDCRFVHYAGYWVKAQIYNYIFDNYTMVDIPASPDFMSGFWKINKNSDLNNEELSKKFNLSLQQIETLRNITNNSEISLDATIGSAERECDYNYMMNKVSLKKTLQNMSVTSFEENFVDKQEKTFKLNKINKEFKRLKIQEQDILLKYYMEEKTFDEIGKVYNVTRQRIEQLQKGAIKKIKDNLKESASEGRVN